MTDLLVELLSSTISEKLRNAYNIVLLFIFVSNLLIFISLLIFIPTAHYQLCNVSITNYDIILIAISQLSISAFIFVLDSKSKENDNISQFFQYFNVSIIIVSLTCFLIAIDLLYNYNWIFYLYQFFNYFQLSGNLHESIISFMNGNGSLDFSIFIPLFSVVSILIIYFSLFTYLKTKTIYVFEEDKVQSTYVNFGYNLIHVLTNLLIPFFVLYLLIGKNDLFQTIIVFDAYFLTGLCFVPLVISFVKIISTYSELSKFYEKSLKLEIKIFMFLKTHFDGFLSIIFFLTFIFTFFAILNQFSIFSIIYILLCLIMWYHVLSIVVHTSPIFGNIRLINGELLENVFIIEDSQKEFIVILNSDNLMKKIYKTSILYVEPSHEEKIGVQHCEPKII